jgi:KTSC domain-containing protein
MFDCHVIECYRRFRRRPESEELTVVFRSGRVYVYRQVSEEVFLALKAAPSKGAFFNRRIRDRYPFAEVTT